MAGRAMDDFEDRLSKAVDDGELTEEEAYREMLEYQTQQQMAEMYDENGDPYRDFMGNPW